MQLNKKYKYFSNFCRLYLLYFFLITENFAKVPSRPTSTEIKVPPPRYRYFFFQSNNGTGTKKYRVTSLPRYCPPMLADQ